ncbi:hypothetical protein ACQPU1_00990 [Clostridium paraputrificum]|uniref:hypothetical protein n=1 Tax=Clostridium TaxID=1485 RepID=UPI003D329136
MGLSNIKKIGALGVLFCSLILVSCGENKINIDKVEGVKLNRGSITENQKGIYSNYNFQSGKYNKIEGEDIVGIYDYESGNYISEEDGKYVGFYNGKNVMLEGVGQNDIKLNLSPKGEYVSYFTKDSDDIFIAKVRSLEDGKEVNFRPKVIFSWRDMDWLDDKTLIYYGTSDDGIYGVYIYNLENGKEELIYELKGGLIQFIKSTEDGAVFLQETIDDKKSLKVIDKNSKEVSIINEDIVEISDILKSGDEYYVLGKKINSGYAIFKLKNNTATRITYDYPQSINSEKGLSIDEEGNILFIGADKELDKSRVYKCSKDGSVGRVSEEGKDFTFINRSIR